MRPVWLIDTSVLCELLEVPGKSSASAQIRSELGERTQRNEQLLLPITTVIETGNHICNAPAAGRRQAAERFVAVIEAAQEGQVPWVLHEVHWDHGFLSDILEGSITRQPFVDLAGNSQMGTGDLAILVERERFRATSAFDDVRIWTLDQRLAAYG